MPNRILREGILTSDRVNSLSWPAEVFYRRLMSVVDDFGRFDARPMVVRAACYPLQLDKVGDADIDKWIHEVEEAGLVSRYTVDGRSYVVLLDFRQQVRAQASKYPQPPSEGLADAKQMLGSCLAAAHLVGVGDGDEGGGRAAGPPHPPGNRQEGRLAGKPEVAGKSEGRNPKAERGPKSEGRMSGAELVLRERELERVESRIVQIQQQYDSHQDMSEKHREEVKRLRARVMELKTMLDLAA